MAQNSEIAEHTQTFTHRYIVHYPAHEPRPEDPYYATFNAYRRQHIATAKCQFGVDRGGDFSECDLTHPLELHHAHIEFALLNEVDWKLLETQYPGISTPHQVGAWIESGANLMFLCRYHHRGHGGVHNATSSDYQAEHFIRQLIR